MLDIIHIGLGAIGRETVAALLARPNAVRLAAAVDTNPQFLGKTVADILGRDTTERIPIFASIAEARRAAPLASVAILTTGSRIPDIQPTLMQLADARLHVVSSCEELAFPVLRHPQLAGEIDAYARDRGVAILGTGVNPGFAMDAFPLVATAACAQVRSITITRSLDAGKRRRQLQQKVGAGLTPAQANALIAQNKLGHVGLAESAALIATGLGWSFDNIDEKFSPVLADQAIKAEHVSILPGQVRGMNMTARATIAGRTLITLDLTMAFDAETFDDIQIDAERPLHLRVTTGFPGDTATVALMINSAMAIRRLSPGLRTMLDLLPLHSLGI